jgi:hypothetical protein
VGSSVDAVAIGVSVSGSAVTLTGHVRSLAEKQAAEKVIRDLKGSRGITNLIAIRSRPSQADVKYRIDSAFQRSAQSNPLPPDSRSANP